MTEARQYGSDAKPEGVTDLGEKDDVTKAFSPNNNFYYIPDTKLEGNIDLHRGAAEPYIEFPAKATGNDRFDAWPNRNDWYETIKLNYGVDYLHHTATRYFSLFHKRHKIWYKPLPFYQFQSICSTYRIHLITTGSFTDIIHISYSFHYFTFFNQ